MARICKLDDFAQRLLNLSLRIMGSLKRTIYTTNVYEHLFNKKERKKDQFISGHREMVENIQITVTATDIQLPFIRFQYRQQQ